MTTLTEFLSTADADSATALVQARAFSEQVLKPIDERMMNERTVVAMAGVKAVEGATTDSVLAASGVTGKPYGRLGGN